MTKREETIRLWFDMWLQKTDLGISEIFATDVCYVESWGPEYHGVETVKHWFREWNTRGTVELWDIKQFFHKGDQTIVGWVFRNRSDWNRPCSWEYTWVMVSSVAPLGAIRQCSTLTVVSPTMENSYWVIRS